jgi:hypothetical protein
VTFATSKIGVYVEISFSLALSKTLFSVIIIVIIWNALSTIKFGFFIARAATIMTFYAVLLQIIIKVSAIA